MQASAEAMTLDRLAMMVQAGFLDMWDRFERVEGRLTKVEERLTNIGDRLINVEDRLTSVEYRLTNVEKTVSDIQIELHDVKEALPAFATVNMHLQLTRRVCVIEDHLKI